MILIFLLLKLINISIIWHYDYARRKPGDFNQAIMDIGSEVCKPKNPNCDICPVKKLSGF
jgi:adenine-specific DNA glycosylase